MKITKKALSVLLAVLMLAATLSVCAVPASAIDETGSLGDNVTWSLNRWTGAMVISGTGPMKNYKYWENPFLNNEDIKTVTIESGVTSIGSYVFSHVKNMTSIVIPKSVTSIGKGAFFRCFSLQSIQVDAGNPSFSSDAKGCLYNKAKTELIQYPIGSTETSFDVPNSVTRIFESAFNYSKKLTRVTIPRGVTTIGEDTFSCCYKLKSIEIPSTVTTIERYAFVDCNALETVEYAGTEAQRNRISVADHNEAFINATFVYITYTITVSAAPAKGGTVSGGGTFGKGETVTIKAVPNTGYKFTGWYYRDKQVSTNATYIFTASADGALRAEFEELPDYSSAAITGFVQPHVGDTASSVYANLKVSEGFTIRNAYVIKRNNEIVEDDYTFPAVTSSNSKYKLRVNLKTKSGFTYANPLTATVNGQSATVEKIDAESYRVVYEFTQSVARKVIVQAEPAEGGTVTGSGTYAIGETVTCTATANPGYEFEGWYNLGKKLEGYGASARFTVGDASTNDIILTAKFVKVTTPEQPDNPGGDQPTQGGGSSGSCKYCGGTHTGFPGVIIGFFHSILALFGLHK